MNRSLTFALLAILSTSTACAHTDKRKLRTARTLTGVGAASVVIGGLTTIGCTNDDGGGVCSGGGETDLKVGVPLIALGAALLTTGLLIKPRGKPALPAPANIPPPHEPDFRHPWGELPPP